MNCDEYGWCKLMPTDEVKPFDSSIDTGLYFVSTTNYRPLRGNGWYFDDTVEQALKHNIISETDIIYQNKPSYVLPPDHFKQFVLYVYPKFEPTYANGGKLAVNGFIGMLGKSQLTATQHYFEPNYDVVANELVNNNNSIHIQGVYETSSQVEGARHNLLNLQDHELDILINTTADRTSEPILYHLTSSMEIPAYENTLPIHRQIYDKANMDMYELELQVKELNPNCELVGIKTDCLVFNNVTTDPPTSNAWGSIKNV